jgi:hypothetical protein
MVVVVVVVEVEVEVGEGQGPIEGALPRHSRQTKGAPK